MLAFLLLVEAFVASGVFSMWCWWT